MRRALILGLFLFSAQLSCHCETTMLPPLQPMNDASTVQNYGQNILADNSAEENADYSNINKIEQSLFGRTFIGQNISIRLSRIEKSLFTRTYSNSNIGQRIDNIMSNYNQINKYPNISNNELSNIEARVFHQNFSLNSTELRIERLEQKIFGAEQSGDLNSRLSALKTAARNYNRNNSSNLAMSNNYGGLKNFVRSFGNSLMDGTTISGSMTGFTPPIAINNNDMDDYDAYNNVMPSNPYNNNKYTSFSPAGCGMYNGCRTNHGYYNSFRNFGSRTGVTILD